jgi:hypothetical protein
MNSPELFEMEFGQSTNFMTPTFVRYVRLSRNACAEISRGEGFDEDELWGVTTVCQKRDGTTRRGSPKSSQVFMSLEEAQAWCERMKRILKRTVHPWKGRGPELKTDTALDEHGAHIETGIPIKLYWIHNNEQSGYYGSNFQQDIEPAGYYVIHVGEESAGGELPKGWIHGFTEVRNPLVLHFNLGDDMRYNEQSWKAQLRDYYEATGKVLTEAIKGDGYDAVVTLNSEKLYPWGTAEIVLLVSPEEG